MARYSVVGLGKLGACIAAAIADRGFEVVGVDIDPRTVSAVNAGRAPVLEPGLDELVARNRMRLRATLSTREAVLASDVTFVVVPTPSDERGAFRLDRVVAAFAEIGRALAEKDADHLVALTSTVLPGATRHALIPVLERESGKRRGEDFGLCYSPEFVALGSVVADFLNPDFVLIGEYDRRSGRRLASCYAELTENGAPCARMSLENAELAKLAVNAFVTTKITFANMLAALCERIPGGDVDAVSGALGLDRRIGRAYLTGGLGFGGPCFPRDNVALAFLARALGVAPELPEATDRANRQLPARVVELLAPLVEHGTRVAVLGLAYKPGTGVVEESQALEVARLIAGMGARVVAHDELARFAAAVELGGSGVKVAGSIAECLAHAEVVVVATPDPAFRFLRSADFEACASAVVVLDCWRALAPEVASLPAVHLLALGHGLDGGAAGARLAGLWETRAAFAESVA